MQVGVPSVGEHYGALEIMEIIHRSLLEMHAMQDEKDLVLKCLVKNGFLAWRPDMQKQRLYDPAYEPWMETLKGPETSHRLKPEWSVDRYHWLDAEGRPWDPDKGADEMEWDPKMAAAPEEVEIEQIEVDGVEIHQVDGLMQVTHKGSVEEVQCCPNSIGRR